MAANAAERRAKVFWNGDIENVTVGEILRCATTARVSPSGSRRLGRAIQRLARVAEILESTSAWRQVVRGYRESQSIPKHPSQSVRRETGMNRRAVKK